MFLRIIPERRLHYVHRSRAAQMTCADLRRREHETAHQLAWQRSESERLEREAHAAARAEQARSRSAAIDTANELRRADLAEHDRAFAGMAPTPEDLAFAAEALARERQDVAERHRLAQEAEDVRIREMRNRPPLPIRPDDMPREMPMAPYDERVDGVWREVLRRRRTLGEALYASSGLPYLLDGLHEAINGAVGPVRPEAAYAAAAIIANDQLRFRSAVEWAVSVAY